MNPPDRSRGTAKREAWGRLRKLPSGAGGRSHTGLAVLAQNQCVLAEALGFTRAGREELAQALPHAHQVRLFVQTGQRQREVAWSRTLEDHDR